MIKTTLAFLGLLVALALAQRAADRLLFAYTRVGADATDEATVRSGLDLRTDFGTGCQYLESRFGGLTQRLAADGRHLCAGRPK